jgi:hypothetical protein
MTSLRQYSTRILGHPSKPLCLRGLLRETCLDTCNSDYSTSTVHMLQGSTTNSVETAMPAVILRAKTDPRFEAIRNAGPHGSCDRLQVHKPGGYTLYV